MKVYKTNLGRIKWVKCSLTVWDNLPDEEREIILSSKGLIFVMKLK